MQSQPTTLIMTPTIKRRRQLVVFFTRLVSGRRRGSPTQMQTRQTKKQNVSVIIQKLSQSHNYWAFMEEWQERKKQLTKSIMKRARIDCITFEYASRSGRTGSGEREKTTKLAITQALMKKRREIAFFSQLASRSVALKMLQEEKKKEPVRQAMIQDCCRMDRTRTLMAMIIPTCQNRLHQY